MSRASLLKELDKALIYKIKIKENKKERIKQNDERIRRRIHEEEEGDNKNKDEERKGIIRVIG